MPSNPNQKSHMRDNKEFNLLAPGRFEWSFEYIIFKLILTIHG